MTLDPVLAADALVNLFGAGGAFVLAREARRADPHAAMTRRVVGALGFVAAFFLLRAFAWSLGGRLSAHIVDLMAATVPLVSLVVAEGLLRRHAPRPLKLALLLAPLALLVVKLPFFADGASAAALAVIVGGGLLCVAALLWRRDVGSLTQAENDEARRVLLALLFLAPLALTDFRSLFPAVPVRCGALGALALLYLGFGAGNLNASLGARLGTLAMLALVAAVFAFGLWTTGGHASGGALTRAWAVGLAGLIFAAILAEARGARAERRRPAVDFSGARDPESFARRLRSHPLLGEARILDAASLADVAHPALTGLFEARPLLRRSAAPWSRDAHDEGVERALALMSAHEASGLAVVSLAPLRLIAFSLPPGVWDARFEADAHLARLAGVIAYAGEAS